MCGNCVGIVWGDVIYHSGRVTLRKSLIDHPLTSAGHWNVIDGQQRRSTCLINLSPLWPFQYIRCCVPRCGPFQAPPHRCMRPVSVASKAWSGGCSPTSSSPPCAWRSTRRSPSLTSSKSSSTGRRPCCGLGFKISCIPSLHDPSQFHTNSLTGPRSVPFPSNPPTC